MFGLSKDELEILKSLKTPAKIQDFLDTVPINWEKQGETYYSPRRVLRHRKAHCFEAALFAAAAFWLQGSGPLIMDLRATAEDDDHVVALFRMNGYWGAISKVNHAAVRWRDPIYRTPREVALSYFHEYFLEKTGRKVLREYSVPLNLKRFGEGWVTAEEDLFDIAIALDDVRHFPLIPKKNMRHIRPADAFDR